MRTRFVPALLSLLLAATVAVINGRSIQQSTRPADNELSITPFGSLVELKAANLKGPLVEGYGIAYRIRNEKIARIAYAVGNQIAKDKLIPDQKSPSNNRALVRTTDKALEITHEYSWDKKTRRLIITRVFSNVSPSPVIIERITNYIEAKLLIPLQGMPIQFCPITNYDNDCSGCPPCPCVSGPLPCHPNGLLLEFLMPGSKLMEIDEKGDAIDRELIATYRRSGVNMKNDQLMPGLKWEVTVDYKLPNVKP